ncbi:MAG: superoxide dismutase [Chloroflexi bacterium]|nr:superoxide dismutase [Chloroflexota bacterium]
MKRWVFAGVALLLALVLVQGTQPAVAAKKAFPDVIALPNGFPPEGITIGRGTTLFAGSRTTGAIYQANLRTGKGNILVPPQTGRVALGLKFDSRSNLLFVAGGPTGNAYVYNAETGATVRIFQLTTASPTFINDEVITRDAVYFTDSFRPVLYRIPLGAGGALPDSNAVQEIPLGGDFQFNAGQFNANGIDASPNGKYLIIVNSFFGALYRVDPTSGVATKIDLGTGSVVNGDGILLRGHTLYVVQNVLNQVAVVKLKEKFSSGEIVNLLTNPNLDTPTTIDNLGSALYVVNARFTTPPTPDTTYTVVRLTK